VLEHPEAANHNWSTEICHGWTQCYATNPLVQRKLKHI